MSRSSLPKPKKRILVDADQGLNITITAASIAHAKCGDPRQCVIATALKASILGLMLTDAEVGATVIKIWTETHCYRFGCSATLRRALQNYDRTFKETGVGVWDLPPGEYTIPPLAKTARKGGRKSRWDRHRNAVRTTGRDTFRPRALPTRRVSRVDTLCTV